MPEKCEMRVLESKAGDGKAFDEIEQDIVDREVVGKCKILASRRPIIEKIILLCKVV